jgi:hypothetical protein
MHDCTLCVRCPVEAIYAEDDVPDAQQELSRSTPSWRRPEADHRKKAGAA